MKEVEEAMVAILMVVVDMVVVTQVTTTTTLVVVGTTMVADMVDVVEEAAAVTKIGTMIHPKVCSGVLFAFGRGLISFLSGGWVCGNRGCAKCNIFNLKCIHGNERTLVK